MTLCCGVLVVVVSDIMLWCPGEQRGLGRGGRGLEGQGKPIQCGLRPARHGLEGEYSQLLSNYNWSVTEFSITPTLTDLVLKT